MKKLEDDPLAKTKGLPKDWDPKEVDRVYYREVTTGDLGYLVRRDGQTRVRLDRPMQDLTRPFRKTSWQVDKEHRPLTKFQVTRMAFEADRQLCLTLGLHSKAKKEWMDLGDDKRMKWAEEGPGDRVERIRLYRGIMSAMAPFMK